MNIVFVLFFVCCLSIRSSVSQFLGAQSTRCLNPNSRSGTCVSIYDCQTLLSVLQRPQIQPSDVEFLKASECLGGYGNAPHVCCSRDTGFKRAERSPQQQWGIGSSGGGSGFSSGGNSFGGGESPGSRIFFPTDDVFSGNRQPPQQAPSQWGGGGFFNLGHGAGRDRGRGNDRNNNNNNDDRSIFSVSTPSNSFPTAQTTSLLPQPPTCGGITVANKIYGGSDADLYEFPWMVLLEYRHRSGRITTDCAGSLISERYVLTAAHCVMGAIDKLVGRLSAILLGEHDTSRQVDCNKYSCATEALRVGYDQIMPHELYNDDSTNKENDIALIRLDRNVQFSEAIKPICLSSVVSSRGRNPPAGTQFTVAGWGQTLKSLKSKVKQKLNVALVDQGECQRRFRQRKVEIVSSQMCAGGNFAEDSCQGDSGGPLMRFRGGAWVLEGIVSFGVKCGLKDWPGVYTRVASYDGWIRNKMRQ